MAVLRELHELASDRGCGHGPHFVLFLHGNFVLAEGRARFGHDGQTHGGGRPKAGGRRVELRDDVGIDPAIENLAAGLLHQPTLVTL